MDIYSVNLKKKLNVKIRSVKILLFIEIKNIINILRVLYK